MSETSIQKQKEEFYTSSIETVCKYFQVDANRWLNSEEVPTRQEKYGKNALPHKKKKTLIRMFFDQLNDWLIYILWVAVIVTTFFGEWTDASIIFLVIIINAVLWVTQEYRANKALEALKKMTKTKALVRRNGIAHEIDSEELVPGDVIILDAGRIIAADIRLIKSDELSIEESALTGESHPAKKEAEKNITEGKIPVGDRVNMAYMSTVVTKGYGEGIVVATGSETEVGNIAHILDTEESTKTPLEKRLDELGKILGKWAIAICILMFIIASIQGRNLLDMFLLSVSLAVASIPEWLAAIVAIVLSIGVTKMSKKNSLIKRLPAVETLGSVDVICTDKTGTLTQNQMTVVETFIFRADQKMWTLQKEMNIPFQGEEWHILAIGMTLASDATLSGTTGTGDPTEIALLAFADKLAIDRTKLVSDHPRIKTYPFDSDRKMMSVLIKWGKEYRVYTKGAVDNILEICTHVMVGSKSEKMTESFKKQILESVRSMSEESLRTLGLAYKETKKIIEKEEMENNLIFVWLVGMIDPPREEVKWSILLAKQAGITPVMITWDYPNTAFAIAKNLNIASSFDEVITGKDIDLMDEKELAKNISQYHVFARVSPEHKVRLVRAFRANGNIVSMTGDGVNDAPSLNAADIWVAMGITGTDVAKWAADMILTDDNFATIIIAVEEGRNIYKNIQKSILFLLTGNLGEVVVMFITIIIGWESPLLAIQLLWINLLTDSFPAIALGMDKWDPEVMKEKPRKPDESFFSNNGGIRTILLGSIIGFTTIFVFWYGYFIHGYSPFNKNTPEEVLDYARTMAFITLILSEMFFALSIQSEKYSIFSARSWKNKILLGSILLTIILQLLLIYNPFLQNIFHLTNLNIYDWDIILFVSLIPLVFNEIRKLFRK